MALICTVLPSLYAASNTVCWMRLIRRCRFLSRVVPLQFSHVNACRTEGVKLFCWPGGHKQLSCLICTPPRCAVWHTAADAVCMLSLIDPCDMCVCVTVKRWAVHASLWGLSTHDHLYMASDYLWKMHMQAALVVNW